MISAPTVKNEDFRKGYIAKQKFYPKPIDKCIGGRYNYIVNRYNGKRYIEGGYKLGKYCTYRGGFLYPAFP